MEYLSTKDLMKMFGVTIQTIQNWRNEGLPHKKISQKKIIYDKEDVMKWIDERQKNNKRG